MRSCVKCYDTPDGNRVTVGGGMTWGEFQSNEFQAAHGWPLASVVDLVFNRNGEEIDIDLDNIPDHVKVLRFHDERGFCSLDLDMD